MSTILFFLLSLITFSQAIPIPNGQLGDAEVECQEHKIEVVFATEEDFLGRIFVIGHADNPKCISRETGGRTTSISIDLEECGSVKTRSVDPPGLFISTKILLSFHDQFITKVDRGYDIQCFYMQAEKTVTYPLMVSMNPVSAFSVAAEMPRCHYEVIDPHTKAPIEIATVGQQLLHTWTCESSSPDLWCMRVHSCFVEDDADTQITILDNEGCAIDRYLLDNLEYGPGDLRAQKEAHAFKFADDVVVNFQCSVRLDVKDGECQVPVCADLGRKRRARSIHHHSNLTSLQSIRPINISEGIDMDVRAPSLQILELQGDFEQLGYNRSRQACYSFYYLVMTFTLMFALILSLIVALIYMIRRK